MPEIEWQGAVGPDDEGLRLDQFLGDHVGSRARAARLIAAGLVEVDGRAVRKRHAVVGGERVTVRLQAVQQAPVSGPISPKLGLGFNSATTC